MENALFYTFSTIAQTLATAFALLGAFILFRLQQITATLEVTSEKVMQPYLPNPEARCLQAEGQYYELLKLLSNLVPQKPQFMEKHSFIAARNAMVKNLDLQRVLKRSLKLALILSVMVILGAVVVLFYTPQIAICAPQTTFAIGLLAFFVCLAMYVRLIWQAVK